MFKEVVNDLWLARISSLLNTVGLYVVLLELLLFMPNSSLHDKYVVVPADKASNNIVFVCKSYYFKCLIKELGINSKPSLTRTLTQDLGLLLSLSTFCHNLQQHP
jgi:hypothetical protein